jgi:hypothetical protein
MNFKLLSAQFIRSLLALSLALPSMEALPEDVLPLAVTDLELQLLPKACHARLRGDQAAQSLWKQRLGSDTFVHLHHFCFGLNFINRAKFSMVKYNKRYYLNQAVGEFAYVLKNWPANSPLRPEAEARAREVQLILKTL